MKAIIRTGGKQYLATANDILIVEKLEADIGTTFTFEEVLLVTDGPTSHIGTPLVKGATVEAEVIDQIKDKKVIIFKKQRRHRHRRKNGHRQLKTVLRIKKVTVAA